MISTGIVRKIDDGGRIVIPKELRSTLQISIKDDIEILSKENIIILKRYKHSCYICNNSSDLRNFKGKKICQECIDDIKAQIKTTIR